MGVKSTVTLTVQEAIEKYADLKGPTMRRLYMQDALAMCVTDRPKLERKLEEMNDATNGGEGFENYTIIDGREPT